jgi:hypothetical protein
MLSPYKSGEIEQIENVQRRATKQIPSLKNMEYIQRLRKQNMPTLKYRRAREDMIEVFKILNGIYDMHATIGMMELNTQANTRGHNKKLKKQSCRLNVRKYSFTSRVVDIWNSLPEEIIVAKTVKEFEIGLDNHWKHKECKYDFSMDINIRSKSSNTGCHVVKSRTKTTENITEADIVTFNYRILKHSSSYESASIFTLINLDIILAHGEPSQSTISNFWVIFTSIESQIIQHNDNYHKRFKHTCGFFFT